MWLPYKIFFTSLHILALPLHIITVLSLVLYRSLVFLLAKITQDFVGPIPGPGALFLSDAIWSRPFASIIVVTELNGDMSEDEGASLFQKIYDLKDQEGQICYRELGYYLVRYLGFGFWKEVPDFQIRDRIHLFNSGIEAAGQLNEGDNISSKTSTPRHEEPLPSIVEGMLRDPYNEDQPLWDVYLLRNYNGKPNRTLVILRFHHLMADGMSLVKLFYALTGSYTLPETFTKASNSVQRWDKIASNFLLKVGTAISLCTVGFIDYINEVLIEQDKHAIHFDENGKLKLTGNWICSMGAKMDLGVLKKASRNHGCSMVHIILAGFCNAMERYFYKYHEKEPMPEGFHYTFPLPIPKHPDLRLVNHWCVAKIHAKFGITSTIAQLDYFKEETKRCAVAALPIMSAFTFKFICGLLPVTLADFVSKARATFTVMLSNVVGPQDNMRLGATSISDMFFWMPIAQESMALSAGVISCNGGIRVCLTADKGCIPDRSRLEDLGMMLHEELLSICEMKESVPTVTA